MLHFAAELKQIPESFSYSDAFIWPFHSQMSKSTTRAMVPSDCLWIRVTGS